MCIAAAIIGGAVVGAAGTAIAGSESANAISSSSNKAIAAQQQALQQQQQLSSPYTNLGQGAVGQLQALTTPGTSLSTLQQMPGFQFAQQQGTTATENAASAMGLGLSGNTLQGLSQFNQGLAQNTFQQQYQDVMGQVQLGQAAAAGQAANIGQAASNVGNIEVGAGQNIAGIDANIAAGLSKSVGGAANQYIGYNTLQNLGYLGGGNSGLPSANYWSDVGLNTPGAIPTVGDIPGVTGPTGP